MIRESDADYMRRALALAERGMYTTTPNPRVGCLIVRGDTVVAEAWHERAGGPHAEARALSAAGAGARGATVYVTLEPCSHHGRTPPCAGALIEAGVARVVAAMQDPNPRVAGKGFAALRAAGVEVESGLLEQEALELNVGFVSRMTRGRPWVRLKIAASLDGKTALGNGLSQWITGEAAREDGHRWRARACAILTGGGTIVKDDPRLNVRALPVSRQPLRVIADSHGEVPPSARVFADANALVAYASRPPQGLPASIECVGLPNGEGKVDLPALLELLARRGVNEVHVEAGARLNGALLREGLVDELLVYLAPKLIGDSGQGMFDLPALTSLEVAQRLEILDVCPLQGDLRVIARIVPVSP